MSSNNHSLFKERLLKGQRIEEDFARKVALIGGKATPLGPPPTKQGQEGVTPVTFYINHNGEQDTFACPDLLIEFEKFSAKAQVKGKKIQGLGKSDEYFILDTSEKELMELSSEEALPTLFVVYCEDLQFRPNLTPFSFINISDLQHDRTRLHRRTINGKSVFIIPLYLFRSFTTKNITQLGVSQNDPQRSRDEYRTQYDPRSVGQPQPGSNESSCSLGHPHHIAVA